MKVLLLSRYGRLGASSRLRAYQYIPYLEANGLQIDVAPLLSDEYVRDLYAGKPKNLGAILATYLRRLRDVSKSNRYDLIWLEKETLPWLPNWFDQFFQANKTPCVVDYDDAIFHNYDIHSKPVVRWLLSRKIDKVMQRADLVIAGNPYLADHARKSGARRIEILPTVVDTNHYQALPRTTGDIFTIGWMGTPVTVRYLQEIQPALAEVCSSGAARLVAVGSGSINLKDVPVEIRDWSEETEVAEILRCDVGIMPLPDAPWERGKCGYKLIQYMACGRPVVASPVGVNSQIVEQEVSGFLAGANSEWINALTILRDDKVLRNRMGVGARIKVEREYSLEINSPRLLSLLKSVV